MQEKKPVKDVKIRSTLVILEGISLLYYKLPLFGTERKKANTTQERFSNTIF